MKRRHFLSRSAQAILTPALSVSLLPSLGCRGAAPTPSARVSPIGLQLYTVRDLMRRNVRETLERVAEIGYREVEFAGYFDHPAAEIRTMLNDLGLVSPAAHVSLESVRSDLPGTLEFARTVGHQYVIVPFLPESARTLDGYERISDEFNRIGESCKDAGIRFGYHNHAFEFDSLGDTTGFDVLLRGTDVELVVMELDLFWIRRGGGDAVSYLTSHPGRFELCHVKDMDAEGTMVDVGAGEMDFASLLGTGRQFGLAHQFVEHDQPTDSLQSIRTSYQYLSNLRV